MNKINMGSRVLALILVAFLSFFLAVDSQDDASVMLALKQSLNAPKQLGWSDKDPCKWEHVGCSDSKRVTRIQLGRQNLQGTLPSGLRSLTALERLELQGNQISGPLPSLSELSSLQVLLLSENNFSSIPVDFFSGMSSLQAVNIDYNPFSSWEIPESLRNASTLQNFSANSANIVGKIPQFSWGSDFPGLVNLHLAFNYLEGELPVTFSEFSVQSLWLNGQKSNNMLTGSIRVMQSMTSLKEVWLNMNAFSGPLPDFSGLKDLEDLNLRDNSFTGPIPKSLLNLPALKIVNLTNNLLQGPVPEFKNSVAVDLSLETSSFCLPTPGECDLLVNTMLSIAKDMGYPTKFAENWKGNDPCASWLGITCNDGNIVVVNFQKMGLKGTISSGFSEIKSLQKLVLANNKLTGPIPEELKTLPALVEIDVSNNQLSGKVPGFRNDVIVNTNGNPDIGKVIMYPSPSTPRIPSGSPPDQSSPSKNTGIPSTSRNGGKKSSVSLDVVISSIIGGVLVIFIVGIIALCLYKRKQKRFCKVQSPNMVVIHPQRSDSDPGEVKVTVAGSSVSGGAASETYSHASSGTGDFHMVEARSMMISMQVLKSVTDNFNGANLLGRGGFGSVYKGELHDGTKIAVKRMNGGGISSEKGLTEFKSEIAVLTKVRHRNLVALLGYCLDQDERILVYEYMPQGTLSRHLFNWQEEGLKPLEWTRRLTIALDVARGVEYLHGLAQQSFIHRDLKPSNIVLGDDMRAKVADFGLVRLAPEGKASVETRIAGTFGYLAPEYAETGRVTMKADVFSFGVILMELLTGRKALDETQPEESIHLVACFRRMHSNKETFRKSIDPAMDATEESLASINTVAELAGHCCAREPYQRPDMGHAVNVISSLVEIWKPANPDFDDFYGIDLDITLPQALKKWQALEGNSGIDESSLLSSFFGSSDNTQTSIPTQPFSLAESFTSSDGR